MKPKSSTGWHIKSDYHRADGGGEIQDAEGRHIATVYSHGIPIAPYVAAAHDAIELLEECASWMADHDGAYHIKTAALRLVAKVKGF